jgi:hypothetical protein
VLILHHLQTNGSTMPLSQFERDFPPIIYQDILAKSVELGMSLF